MDVDEDGPILMDPRARFVHYIDILTTLPCQSNDESDVIMR